MGRKTYADSLYNYTEDNYDNHKQKKKYRIKKFRVFLFLLIIVGISVGIIVSPISKTRNLVVNGNTYIKDNEIIEKVNLDLYPNFFLFNKKSAVKKLKADERIKDASIMKRWFGSIEVNIEENRMLCYSSDNNYVYLENSKKLFVNTFTHDVPVLVSDVPNNILNLLLSALKEVPYVNLSQISEIFYDPTEYDEESFKFLMTDGNTVYVTLVTLSDRMKNYTQVVEQVEGKKGIFYFDLRNETIKFVPYEEQ